MAYQYPRETTLNGKNVSIFLLRLASFEKGDKTFPLLSDLPWRCNIILNFSMLQIKRIIL